MKDFIKNRDENIFHLYFIFIFGMKKEIAFKSTEGDTRIQKIDKQFLK